MKALAALISIILFAGLPSAYASSGEQSLASGIDALKHRQADKAIRLFTMGLLSNQLSKNEQVVALINRGNAWIIKIDRARALADFKAAARIEPDAAIVHAYLGKVYTLEDKLDKASAEYRRALNLDPRYSKAYAGMCRVNFYRGRYEQALRDCDQALYLKPDSVYAHLARGNVLSAQGKYRDAIRELNKSIIFNMSNPEPYYDRGFALFYDGDFKQAAEDFAQAQTGNQANPYMSIWRYMAQARAGNRRAQSILWSYAQKSGNVPDKKNHVSPWPGDAILMFTGRMQPAQVMKSLSKTRYQQSVRMEYLCEGSYFIGEWDMIHKQRAQAKKMFLKTMQYCPMIHDHVHDDAQEYDGASAELARMHASPVKGSLE